MKKAPALIWLSTFCLGMVAWSGLALAQSTSPTPPPPTATPPPITREPLPPTPPPPPPLATVTSTQQTQQAGGSTGSGTTGTTGTGTTGTNLSGQVSLPILDIGLTQETQETQQQCETQQVDSSMCISPTAAREAVLPPVMGEQLQYSLLVFSGAVLGGILWIITYVLMGRAQQKRDRLQFERQARYDAESHRVDNLHKNYDDLCNALGNIFVVKSGKYSADKNAITSYKKASTDIDLFGSDETVAANKNLLETLTGSKNPDIGDFNAAKDRLMASLKKDLGLV